MVKTVIENLSSQHSVVCNLASVLIVPEDQWPGQASELSQTVLLHSSSCWFQRGSSPTFDSTACLEVNAQARLGEGRDSLVS